MYSRYINIINYKMKKRLFLIFAISLFLSIALASLRGGYISILGMTGFPLSSLVGYVVLGAGTIWTIVKYRAKIKPLYIVLSIWLGVSILDLVFRIQDFSSSLISLPNIVIWWLGILMGYIYTTMKNKIVRGSLIVISLCFVLWGSGAGYKLFLHKLNFGTFHGEVKEKIMSPIVFRNECNENINLSDFKGKYVILDFWNSYCGVCFREFPEVERLYAQIKNDSNILFYSVHCFYTERGETYKTGNDILHNEGYYFPCLSLPIQSHVVKSLNIKAYPTVLIMDKQSNIIHRGNIESVKKKVSELLNHSI